MASKRVSNRKIQARNLTVMTYCPVEFIREVLNLHADDIRAYAYIYHDKFSAEELGDKERKEPHYHIVLRLNRPFTESAVSKWFVFYNSDGLRQRVDVKATDDPFECYDYLIHKHHPEKYQFSEHDIVCNFPKAFKRKSDNISDDNALNALNDLINGTPVYTVCKRYGRDIIYHLNALVYAKFLISRNSSDCLPFSTVNFVETDEDLENVF